MDSTHRPVGERSVYIGRDASGNVIVTGDNNTASLQQVPLPPPESVDIKAELAALRQALAALNSPDQRKVDNALSDAEAELEKPEPDKDEVGTALERALGYAQKAEGFGKVIDTLKPHLIPVAAWLGTNWDKVLATVGLAR